VYLKHKSLVGGSEDNISTEPAKNTERCFNRTNEFGCNLQIHKIPFETTNGPASSIDRFFSRYCTVRFIANF